jgi:hypothetical protein
MIIVQPALKQTFVSLASLLTPALIQHLAVDAMINFTAQETLLFLLAA